MPLSEFEMITRYFRQTARFGKGTVLGIGDDAALINVPDGFSLTTSILQWIEGNDFLFSDGSQATGKQVLDAAMMRVCKQVKPQWMTLSLTLEHIDENWVAGFSEGLLKNAAQNNIQLVGGDSTRGPGAIRLHLTGLRKVN